MNLTGKRKLESRNLPSHDNFPPNGGWISEEGPKIFGKLEIMTCPYKKVSRTSLICQKFGKELPMFDVYFPLFGIIMISFWLIASIKHIKDGLMYILESWEIDQSCRGSNHIVAVPVIP
jgi:hypothetical protein